MHKHLTWALPHKYEQNLLSNSLQFQNKEIIFTIPKGTRLTIQFQIKADFDVIGPQNLEYRFVLKKNDEIICSSPAITRSYKKSFKFIFTQSLNIEQSNIFDQNQDDFTIEIDVQELELSGISTPNISKVNSQDRSNIQSSPFELTKNIDVQQIATPKHLFSPIRLKNEELTLENIDQIEHKTSKPILTKSTNIETKTVESKINDPTVIYKSINVNDLIIDSPKSDDDNNNNNQSTESDDDSSSTSDNTLTALASSPFSLKSEKKNKKKKKKLSDILTRIKSPKDNIEKTEMHIKSESQPISEPPKPIQNHSIKSESQLASYPQVTSPSQNDSSTSDESSSSEESSDEDAEIEDQIIDQDQSDDKDQPTESYCGLFNQGATCYMNSMLQAFYHLPAFRRLIYCMDTTIGTENESKEKSIKSNIPLQLQKLFATMQTTTESACSTRDLTRSFGWTDEDTIMQHDVQEFCRVILDNLETKIDKQPEIKGSIQNLFRGKTRSYIRCTNVNFESKRDEYFYDLSLDVKGCRNLKESFFKYIEKEKLNGKNQYDTGDPSLGKQDAVMGNEFVQFPPVLHLHLRRFEYNGTGMSKIYSRFEFPLEINLGRFMADDGEDKEDQIFDLFGVLVHSGTVDGGHYYAFLRPTEKQKWFEFNDSKVSLSSIKEAVNDNYGGSSNDDFVSKKKRHKFAKKNHHNDKFNNLLFRNNRFSMMNQQRQQHQFQNHFQEHQRYFSAYMLIYIRKKEVPFLYKKVSNDEIPEEIKDLIRQQEELRRKREEEKRIQENTIVFHIYNFPDIGNPISNTNKFALPNPTDFSIGSKFTALRDDKFSVLYDKVLRSFQPENQEENENKINFEFWPINNFSIGLRPIESSQKITFPMSQSLFMYFTDFDEYKEQQSDQKLFIYPYILLFVFVYCPLSSNPIMPIKVIKVNKTNPVRFLFDDINKSGHFQCKNLYKSVQAQMVQEITNIDSSFEENKIKNGSFLIFEIENFNDFQSQVNNINNENERILIKKYNEVFKTESVVEYLDIIRNTINFRVITTEANILQNSLIEYQVYFPRNRNFRCFIQFLRFVLKIPEIKTIVLYENASKTPLKFQMDQNLMDIQKFESLKLFQFDSISRNVFEHSLLISFRIIGSLVDLADSTFNCWMNEESTIADLASYVENAYITQLSVEIQNQMAFGQSQNDDEEEDENECDKERIRQRVILSYNLTNGESIRVFAMKREGVVVYPPDTKLSNTESTLMIDIPTENQYIFNDIIMKDIERTRMKKAKEEEEKQQKQQQQQQQQKFGFFKPKIEEIKKIVDPLIDNNDDNENDRSIKQLDSLLPQEDFENNQIDPVCAAESEIPPGILTNSNNKEGEENSAAAVVVNVDVVDDAEQYPKSQLLHIFVSEITMNKVCRIKKPGNSLISVFDGETMTSIRKRLAFLLNKDENYFFCEDKNKFSFALFMPNNQYMKMVPKDDEPLFPLLDKGYKKLRVTTISSANSKMGTVSSSHSFSKDDSVVIKN